MYDGSYGTAIREILHFIHSRKTGLDLRHHLILPVPELHMTGMRDLWESMHASLNQVLIARAAFEMAYFAYF